ncbi:L-Ala-D/L-Glu epimerase [Kordia antarctica]|uniref:L-Ala-D/L-Glu epimerase n=1 Tax=Kordia antarctica TaxID=1218801 RepID=A0A7L4ZH81_9FLAO|nr:o-succinylbenzoate synthase [Kordia antarctica]QHI35841.1 L-Ala-D/L-Glu epimerase [Kordia antarctica]
MKATYHKHILDFKRPSGTSRGILKQKETWFIVLHHDGKQGIGECGILRSLSIDDVPEYEEKLRWTCENIQLGKEVLLMELIQFPSLQFGVEQAFLSLVSETPYLLFPSEFTRGNKEIEINGLVWMGDVDFMKSQIEDKLKAGFSCIKMKIGAIDFETELKLLQSIRNEYSVNDIELRVDANGAFTPENALEKLKILSELQLHSIEQPIKQGQVDEMAKLCKETPLPIALDEELIGIFDIKQKKKILETIQPQFIILKPSLVGGFAGSSEWISLAEKNNIDWWITSALESNIGLNAIAQWTYTLHNKLPQGLGTGSLYTNNFDSPLTIQNGALHYEISTSWKVPYIKN